jgi:hypothetical protein
MWGAEAQRRYDGQCCRSLTIRWWMMADEARHMSLEGHVTGVEEASYFGEPPGVRHTASLNVRHVDGLAVERELAKAVGPNVLERRVEGDVDLDRLAVELHRSHDQPRVVLETPDEGDIIHTNRDPAPGS